MDMPFFVSCPIRNALAGPDKSGHTRNKALSTMAMGSWCPDLRGTLRPPVKGHDAKKDISMLLPICRF
jgi:hypothetical protein